MPNEHWDRVEARLDRLEAGVEELKSGHGELTAGQAQLTAGQAQLTAGYAQLVAGQEELRRHMHVLHEDVVDRIKAISTDGPTREEMRQEFAELREAIGRRLDPLEAAVRGLSRG